MVALAAASAASLPVDAAVGLRRWPRFWSEREPLLELQHDRLEALLAELIAAHRDAVPAWTAAEACALDASCRRLLWDLRLHLRLEERWLDQAGLQTRLLMQVHDELILEVPQAELARVQAGLPGLMTGVASLRVPLLVDVGVGSNWEQAH